MHFPKIGFLELKFDLQQRMVFVKELAKISKLNYYGICFPMCDNCYVWLLFRNYVNYISQYSAYTP